MHLNKFRFVLFILLLFCFSLYSQNRCSELYDIHLGFNAFNNINKYSIGVSPDLQYADIIYNNFPKDNDVLKKASKFSIDFSLKREFTPLDSILKNSKEKTYEILTYLSYFSKLKGYDNHRKYLSAFNEDEIYLYFYKIWTFPIKWNDTSRKDQTELDKIFEVVKNNKSINKSDLLLFNLFKLEINYENSNDKKEFLSQLESLITNNIEYFSLKNYNDFIKNYFPEYKFSNVLISKKNDSFNIEKNNCNSIYSAYRKTFNSMSESIKQLVKNPYPSSTITSNENVKTWIYKENFTSIIKNLNILDSIESTYKKESDLLNKKPPLKCWICSDTYNLIYKILNIAPTKFNSKELSELRFRYFKKWFDYHVICNYLFPFNPDFELSRQWNNLSYENKKNLYKYFEEILLKNNQIDDLIFLERIFKRPD